jgi:putative oxidoreductase
MKQAEFQPSQVRNNKQLLIKQRETAMQTKITYPVGRAFIGALFLISGVFKIMGFAGMAGYMSSAGLPMVNVLLVITIAIEIGCGLSLVTGWKALYGSVVLALFLIPITFVFHAFWNADPANFSNQITNFLKNLAIFGGMLMVIQTERALVGVKK